MYICKYAHLKCLTQVRFGVSKQRLILPAGTDVDRLGANLPERRLGRGANGSDWRIGSV